MKTQAVRRSALFMRARTWWRAVEPSPYFLAAFGALVLAAYGYAMAMLLMGWRP